MKKDAGQTFVEVIIVVSIVVMVITALVSGSISSLKITGYNSLKSQATKYAEEGVELARKERDISWNAFYSRSLPSPRQWCVDKNGTWTAQTPCPVNIDSVFTRTLILSYDPDPTREWVAAQVTVSWRDGANTRMSKVETHFTQWR